jgi:lysozyme
MRNLSRAFARINRSAIRRDIRDHGRIPERQAMKMSEQGRRLLTQREGVRLKAYRDTVGVWTIGVGHTAAAGPPSPVPGMVITAAECERILSRDLVLYEKAIAQALKVMVAQHEFDALVSICFNVGPKFAQSICIKRLNTGDRRGAAAAIMMWSKPPEIVGRRRTEQRQFLTPYTGKLPAVDTSKPSAGRETERSVGLWQRIASLWRRS